MTLMVGDWNMGGTGIYSPGGEYGRAARPELARSRCATCAPA